MSTVPDAGRDHADPGGGDQLQELPGRLGGPTCAGAATLAAARKKGYAALRAEHIADHQKLFRRVTIDLGHTPPPNCRPTSASPQFATGQRSVAGGAGVPVRPLPADRVEPAGRAAGEPAGAVERIQRAAVGQQVHGQHQHGDELLAGGGRRNLAECQVPLFDAMKDLRGGGRGDGARSTTTRGGWVLHHNFDLWRGTAPINASNHGIWQTGGAWLSHAPVGALPVHAATAVSARHGVPADEGRGAVLRRRDGEGSARPGSADHRARAIRRSRAGW